MTPLRTLPARVVAAAAAGIVALSACTGSTSGSSKTYHYSSAQAVPNLIAVSARKPADDFTGSLLNGGTYKLTQDAGKVTVVNFWGAWCGPCKVETPQFAQIYDAYKTKGVTFVGIDVKEPGRSAPRAFVKTNHIDYPIVYDDAGEVAVRLGNVPTQAVPFTILLDKQHRVAAVYIQRLAPTDLEPVLNKLMAEK